MKTDDLISNQQWMIIIGDNGFIIASNPASAWDANKQLINPYCETFTELGIACTHAYQLAAERCIQIGSGPIFDRIMLPMYPPIDQIAHYG